MTSERDDLSKFRDAYLDYLEGNRDEPPALEDLPEEQRRAAKAFIKSIMAARGVDPYASRPSIERLLASRSQTNDRTSELGEVLQNHLRLTVDHRALVIPDAASAAVGLASGLGDPGPWHAYPRRARSEFSGSRLCPHQEGRRHRWGEPTADPESALNPYHLASKVVDEVSTTGARARIEAKRATWGDFGVQEAQRLATIVQEAQLGQLSEEDYKLRLDELVGIAA